MAIAPVATFLSAQNKTAESTTTFTTSSAIAAGNVGVICIGFDNISTGGGATTDISSVTVGGVTCTKVIEWANAAAAEAACSQWIGFVRAVSEISSGANVVITFASSVTAKVASGWEFSVASGKTLELDGWGAWTVDNDYKVYLNEYDIYYAYGVGQSKMLYPLAEHLLVGSSVAEYPDGTWYSYGDGATPTLWEIATTSGGTANTNISVRPASKVRTPTGSYQFGWGPVAAADLVAIIVGLREVDAAAGSYTLTAEVGAFILTGVNLTALKRGLRAVASVATFIETGINLTALKRGLRAVTAVGTFTETGINVVLKRGFRVVTSVAAFTLTGIDSTLKRGLRAITSVGEFSLTGVDAVLRRGLRTVTGVGSFVLTGVDSVLKRGLRAVTSAGEFVLTGIDVILTKSGPLAYTLTAAVGEFVLSGVDATLKRGLKASASVGTFALTGIDATLKRGLRAVTASASFSLTGIASVLKRGLRAIVGTGAYTLTGIPVDLNRTTGGAFHVTTPDHVSTDLHIVIP